MAVMTVFDTRYKRIHNYRWNKDRLDVMLREYPARDSCRIKQSLMKYKSIVNSAMIGNL